MEKITKVSQVLKYALDDLKEIQLANGCIAALKTLSDTIDHVMAYWISKIKVKEGVLFSMADPPLEQIGYLIRLSCGHNGRLSDIEMGMLSMHLERVGFNGSFAE